MTTFCITVPFMPTIPITARVEPYDEGVIDPRGFLALEASAGLLLQEDGTSRFLLESSVLPLTADSTIRTVDTNVLTADQTFILDVS